MMMRTPAAVFALALALTLGWAGAAVAGDEIADVTPDQLESLLNAGTALAVDANGSSVRSKHGTVPEAILLSDYKRYDPTSELPAEKGKQLVFYCANTMCSAAPAAAEKASGAGYNVAIMSEGIMGWARAGKTVAKDKAG